MAWIALFVAGLLEVVWAFTMKQSAGFTRLGPSLVTLVAMIASVALLSYSMRTLPLGTAYTIWTGIGWREPGVAVGAAPDPTAAAPAGCAAALGRPPSSFVIVAMRASA